MSNPQALVEKYESQPAQIRGGIAGLDAAQLSAVPVPGKWSIQQLVMHLADAEAAFTDRCKRIIAEDNPTLLSWDEQRFIERLMYEQQSPEDAVALIELTRRQFSRVLRKLPAEAFNRAGTHSQRGSQTLADVLEYNVKHVDHHMAFLRQKRQALGSVKV